MKNLNKQVDIDLPSRNDIFDLLDEALEKLYNSDYYLISSKPSITNITDYHHVGERSIVFRLAHYMQNIMDDKDVFTGYVVDCEYNRNLTDIKNFIMEEVSILI